MIYMDFWPGSARPDAVVFEVADFLWVGQSVSAVLPATVCVTLQFIMLLVQGRGLVA